MGRSFIAINQTSGIFVLGGFMINRRRQRLRVVLRMGSVFIAISRRPRNHDGPRIGLIDDFFGNVFFQNEGVPLDMAGQNTHAGSGIPQAFRHAEFLYEISKPARGEIRIQIQNRGRFLHDGTGDVPIVRTV